MISLLAGLLSVYAGLLGWALFAQPEWLRWQPTSTIGWLVGLLVAIPLGCAWLTAEVMNLAGPRRIFDARLKRGWARFGLGVCAGVAGAILGAAVLVIPGAERIVPDAASIGGAAVLAIIGTMLPLSRRRAGHCIYCTYDLRTSPGPGQPGAGVCPECGASAST